MYIFAEEYYTHVETDIASTGITVIETAKEEGVALVRCAFLCLTNGVRWLSFVFSKTHQVCRLYNVTSPRVPEAGSDWKLFRTY